MASSSDPEEEPEPRSSSPARAGQSEGDPSERGSFLQSFASIGREERRFCLAAGVFFFAVLGSYYMMRPLRDAYGAERPSDLRFLFLGTLALTAVLQPLFGLLCRKFGRRRILPASYRVLAIATVGFGVALANLEGAQLRHAQNGYFCWVATYPILGVSLFWGMLADLLGRARSLRLFGFIAVGGTLGAIFGASVAGFAQSLLPRIHVGPAALTILSAVLLEACVWLTGPMERLARELPGEDSEGERPDRAGQDLQGDDSSTPIGGGILSGFSRVGRSPYLMGVAAYVVIYVFGSTLLYQLGAEITKDAFESTEVRTAFFARVDLAVNVLTLVLQLFATRWVMEKIGVGVALAAVPIISSMGFAVLAVEPTLLALAVFQVLRRGCEYGVSKPARDALFTVLSKEDKYKSKLVVDSVAYRGGDAAALWSKHGLLLRGVSEGALAWGLVGLAGAGAFLSLMLGRSFRRRGQGAEHF